MICYNAECHYDECPILFTIMLSVITLSIVILNVIMLNVIMLRVIMLNVVAPINHFISMRKTFHSQRDGTAYINLLLLNSARFPSNH